MKARFIVRQEHDTLAQRKLVVTTIGSIVVFTAAVIAAVLLLDAFREGRDRGAVAAQVAPNTIGTVEQRLILSAPRGLDDKRDQRASLDRWGWVDRDAGLATIPVERAMDLIVAEGLEGGAP
jgi:hypothetical protein